MRDAERARSARCTSTGRTIVFHLAAQPLVRASYDEPRETFETNVMGTVNLFEAVRATQSVRAVVNVTTDKCYENREWVVRLPRDRPDGRLRPVLVAQGLRRARDERVPPQLLLGRGRRRCVASVRAGNVIGGGDWARGPPRPGLRPRARRGREHLRAQPGAVRPWQHVLEPLSGYLWLGARLLRGEQDAAQARGTSGPNTRGNVTVRDRA